MRRRTTVLLAGVIVLVALMIAVAIFLRPPARVATPQMMTLDPQAVLNATLLPQATPLSAEDSTPLEALRQMVAACPDYSADRRAQMNQHIDWIINPSTLPDEIVAVALGANPQGRLIFGMASFTSNQWRLDGRNPESCLLPIGRRLNEMLLEAGEPPFAIFEDGDG